MSYYNAGYPYSSSGHSGAQAGEYTSMYRTTPTKAAMQHGHARTNDHPLNQDLKESMDFLARYCRGESSSLPHHDPSNNSMTASTPYDSRSQRARAGLSAGDATGYRPTSFLPSSQGGSQIAGSITPLDGSTNPNSGTNNNNLRNRGRPSWISGGNEGDDGPAAYFQQQDHSSSGVGMMTAHPSGRARNPVGTPLVGGFNNNQQEPRIHYASSTSDNQTHSSAAGKLYQAQMNDHLENQHQNISDRQGNNNNTLTHHPGLVGGGSSNTTATVYQHHSPIRKEPGQKPPSTVSPFDQNMQQDNSFQYQHIANSAHQQPLRARSASQRTRDDVWAPHPALGEPEVLKRYEGFADNHRTLLYIMMYLKNYFGTADEMSKGLETLSDPDVGELLQLYSNELGPLLHQIRQESRVPIPEAQNQRNNQQQPPPTAAPSSRPSAIPSANSFIEGAGGAQNSNISPIGGVAAAQPPRQSEQTQQNNTTTNIHTSTDLNRISSTHSPPRARPSVRHQQEGVDQATPGPGPAPVVLPPRADNGAQAASPNSEYHDQATDSRSGSRQQQHSQPSQSAPPPAYNTPTGHPQPAAGDQQQQGLDDRGDEFYDQHSPPQQSGTFNKENSQQIPRQSTATDLQQQSSTVPPQRQKPSANNPPPATPKQDSQAGSQAQTPREEHFNFPPPAMKRSIGESLKLMRRGNYLIKYGRNGAPANRFFIVKDDNYNVASSSGDQVDKVPFFTWSTDVDKQSSGSFPFFELQAVERGPVNKNFKRKDGKVVGPRGEVVDPAFCFSLKIAKRTVDLAASNQEDFDLWYGGMLAVCERNKMYLDQPANKNGGATAARSGSANNVGVEGKK